MADFEFRLTGAAELKATMLLAPQISLPIYQKAINAAGAILAKHTLKDNPVPWRTGNLLHSFRAEVGTLQVRWKPTASYAAFVQYGTKPHIITPKTKRVLANVKTNQIFGKLVHHPGTKPNDYMGAILRNSENDLNKLFDKAVGQVLEAIAKNYGANF